MSGPPDPVARSLRRRWPAVTRRPLLRVPRRWLRLPRRTVRLRLTLVYGGLFLLSGAALLAITYLLVSRSMPTGPVTGRAAVPAVAPHGAVSSGEVFVQAKVGNCGFRTGPLGTSAQVAARARQCLSQQRSQELNRLLTESGIALAIMTVVSIGLGWLVAGRVLRKLSTITAAARSISPRSISAAAPAPRRAAYSGARLAREDQFWWCPVGRTTQT